MTGEKSRRRSATVGGGFGKHLPGGAHHRPVPPAYCGFPALGEADKGEVAERRHSAPFRQPHVIGAVGPIRIALPRKLGAPAEFPRCWSEPFLQRPPQSGFRAHAAYQHDLAAGRWRKDRKSTRLNSSHQIISYAVFCLKKKKHPKQQKGRIPRTSASYNESRHYGDVQIPPTDLGCQVAQHRPTGHWP